MKAVLVRSFGYENESEISGKISFEAIIHILWGGNGNLNQYSFFVIVSVHFSKSTNTQFTRVRGRSPPVSMLACGIITHGSRLVYIVNPRVFVLRAKPAVSWGGIWKNIFEVKWTRQDIDSVVRFSGQVRNFEKNFNADSLRAHVDSTYEQIIVLIK